MNISKKKDLAMRTLGVGRERIIFLDSRMDEIKEAITKQDIKDLLADGAIFLKDIRGKKKIVKRKRQRGPGKVRKKVNTRKQDYVILTRKLRKHIAEMKKRGELTAEESREIRKKIRNKFYRSLNHMKDLIKGEVPGRNK